MNNLLNVRNKMKARKPKFERQDVNIFRQFRGQWRKPKGIHSKLRRGFKGHGSSVSIGYSSPRDVKGLTKKGFVPVVVSNINDLSKVTDGCVVVLAHGVGIKKRIEILNKAKEKKLSISGIKDIDVYINKAKENFSLKKKVSNTRREVRKKKIEEAEKNKEVKSEDKKDESKK